MVAWRTAPATSPRGRADPGWCRRWNRRSARPRRSRPGRPATTTGGCSRSWPPSTALIRCPSHPVRPLPAVRPGEHRPVCHRVGPDPPLSGEPAAGAVRAAERQPAGRADAAGLGGCAGDVQVGAAAPPHARLGPAAGARRAAQPVILSETIVSDQCRVFISDNFRTACASLGVSFQPAHPDTPADKPQVERHPESVASLFSQYVSGYLGRPAEYRGRKVEDEPLWSLTELQDLLDEWIVAAWQNRPHDGLRDPVTPGRAFTRTRSTRPWWSPRATSRSRCRPTTTSRCCPRPGGRSTPTASRSATASMTATS